MGIYFKDLIKVAMRGMARLVVLPLVLYVKALMFFTRREQPFQTGAEVLSMVPGLSGIYLRREYYRCTLPSCSEDCCIEFGTFFAHSTARIGSRVYIGQKCSIGSAIIAENVLIGSNVDILSGRRQHFTSDTGKPIMDQGGEFSCLRIGEGSWIGNSSVVMADVGSNSVVGAGSVVVHPVPDNTVVVGNPAHEVKKRAGA